MGSQAERVCQKQHGRRTLSSLNRLTHGSLRFTR